MKIVNYKIKNTKHLTINNLNPIKMKTLMKFQKIAISFLIAALVMMTFSTCNKDDDDNTQHSENVSGKWEFILAPDVIVPDTTIAHGYTGTDFEEYASINDEVFLYQDENGNIKGFAGAFKLTGKLDGKNLSLQVYINPDGEYDPMRPIEEMGKFSIMTLVLNDFGLMAGTGTYEENPEFPNIENNTYLVEARMLTPIRNFKSGMEDNHLWSFLCKELDKLANWIASDLTDGKVRGMGGCSLYKDGPGYYLLGHKGPGDFHSIFTTTIYYPYQWYHCHNRTYGFEISLEEENISLDALIHDINSTDIKELAKKLGFTIPDDLPFGVELFYNEFGGFGISMAYDTKTHNISIYVNHTKGSSEDAKNNILIQNIKSAFEPHAKNVSVFAGSSVHDTWYLTKSAHFTCNTPLVITYLLGTHNVNYN